MKNRVTCLGVIVVVVLAGSIALSSCKGGSNKDAVVSHTDTAAAPAAQLSPLAGANLPHADSSLAPVLAKVLDAAFDASKTKDYAKLATYLAYRGPDMKRMGTATFTVKNAYERGVVRITGEVFNKWASNCETKDYARIFSFPQPDGSSMIVMEVIFASPKGVNRKFFGFMPLVKDEYKIVDVTSNLGLPQ